MRLLPLALSLAVAAVACKTPPPPPPSKPARADPVEPKLRLPGGAVPTAYALNLTAVAGEQTFGGDVIIDVEATEPLNVLWLNATGLTFSEAELAPLGGPPVHARTEVHPPDFVAVIPSEVLPAGKYKVRLVYSALLSRIETLGLFQLDDNGSSYIATQFEAIGARRAFPCFDEPQFKVPFKISLGVRTEDTAFSNAPVDSESKVGAGVKVVNFKTTAPLPTYLVALAAGPFETVEAGTAGQNKVPLRIITPKGRAGQAKFAAAESPKILDALEAWFGTPYPYEKLDLLGLPTRFGAMENPGLVTYGYQTLLAQPEEDTPQRQRDFHVTTSHELSHMWFGDWVTMKWWDDLWLNESFAEWMDWKISAGLHPEWNLDVDRVRELDEALNADSLASARKMRQPIGSDDDIVNAFDAITYSKGASVLASFEQWLGPEVFQKGVRAHLAAHPFGNATADEFLAALGTAAGKDVAAPMKTFLDQVGVPKVTVECVAGSPVTAKLTQGRHLVLGSKADAAARWQVPVCLRWAGKPDGHACTLLAGDEGSIELTSLKACPAWLVPNDAYRGYYESVVLAKNSPVAAVQAALEAKPVSRPEKVGLLSSIHAAAASGQIEIGEALAVVPVALKQDAPELWTTAAELATSIHASAVSDAQRPKYQAWLQSTFGARVKKLGFKVGAADDAATRVARPELLMTLGLIGQDPALRLEGQKQAAVWLGNHKAVHADLVSAALAIGADGPDAEVFDKLLAAAKDEKDQATRARMFRALSNARDPARVRMYLELVKLQSLDAKETGFMLFSASQDPRSRDEAWKFLEASFDSLVRRLPTEAIGGFPYLGAGYCDEAGRKKVDAFFAPKAPKFLGMPRVLTEVLETIDLCIVRKARQEPSVAKLLK
jgi:alanyl aminopeptidase